MREVALIADNFSPLQQNSVAPEMFHERIFFAENI